MDEEQQQKEDVKVARRTLFDEPPLAPATVTSLSQMELEAGEILDNLYDVLTHEEQMGEIISTEFWKSWFLFRRVEGRQQR